MIGKVKFYQPKVLPLYFTNREKLYIVKARYSVYFIRLQPTTSLYHTKTNIIHGGTRKFALGGHYAKEIFWRGNIKKH